MSKIAKLLRLTFAVFYISPVFAATEIRDTEIESVVYEIARPIIDAADFPADRAKIRILSDNNFNAFVGGGTDIFINTGLIVKIESPAELQAVLAHEIGHAQLGHVVQLRAKMRAEATRSMIMSALGIGMMAAYNAHAGMGVAIGAGAFATQSVLSFTRDEERSADDYAVKVLDKAGSDPAALLSVFQKMQNARESKINPNNIGHPLTEERIKNIKLQINRDSAFAKASADKSGFGIRDSKELKMIQAKLIGYLDSAERVRTLFPNSDTGNPALYARAIMRTRAGDLDGAKIGTMTLISRDKNNPYFYELLGDIEFKSGHYDDSVKAYEESLKKMKSAPHSRLRGNDKRESGNDKQSAPQIELALALVLSERRKPGDLDRAAELCKRAILVEPMPLAYWILAKTDGKKSDYYLAEFYYLNNDLKQAKAHAKKAAATMPSSAPEYLKAKDILDAKAENSH